jgi:hypothetical protein
MPRCAALHQHALLSLSAGLKACRKLTDLFASDPECTKSKVPKVPRGREFAGGQVDDDFEMKRLQVKSKPICRPALTNSLPSSPTISSLPAFQLLRAPGACPYDASNGAAQVFVRIRPLNVEPGPSGATEGSCLESSSETALTVVPPEGSQAFKSGDRQLHRFSFTRVYDQLTTQQQYFEGTAAPLVSWQSSALLLCAVALASSSHPASPHTPTQTSPPSHTHTHAPQIRDLLRERQHNSVMMAYGITSAGKTHTMEGTKRDPGVVPRALDLLFTQLQRHAEPVAVRVSHAEVYNEQIYDLLDEQVGVGGGGGGHFVVALWLVTDSGQIRNSQCMGRLHFTCAPMPA